MTGERVTWKNLRDQVGQEYPDPKNFKRKMVATLRSVLAVYPDAKIEPVLGGLILASFPTAGPEDRAPGQSNREDSVRAYGYPWIIGQARLRLALGQMVPLRVGCPDSRAACTLVDSESCLRVVGTQRLGRLAPLRIRADGTRLVRAIGTPLKPIIFPYRCSAIFLRLLQAKTCGVVDSRPRGRPGSGRGVGAAHGCSAPAPTRGSTPVSSLRRATHGVAPSDAPFRTMAARLPEHRFGGVPGRCRPDSRRKCPELPIASPPMRVTILTHHHIAADAAWLRGDLPSARCKRLPPRTTDTIARKGAQIVLRSGSLRNRFPLAHPRSRRRPRLHRQMQPATKQRKTEMNKPHPGSCPISRRKKAVVEFFAWDDGRLTTHRLAIQVHPQEPRLRAGRQRLWCK